MVRTQISLTDEQYEYVKRQASMSGESMASIIRQAVDNLRQVEEEKRQRAVRLLGAFEADQDDVSEHHDRYLADALAQ